MLLFRLLLVRFFISGAGPPSFLSFALCSALGISGGAVWAMNVSGRGVGVGDHDGFSDTSL